MLTAAASCASLTFVVNIPLFQATRSMAKNGALLLGYQSVDDFYDANALMIDASTLFPGNSAYLAGMKLFSNVNTDETLRAAASLAAYAGSVIGSVFSDVFENGDTRLYPVENYVYEDSLGLCGWIHSQRVLLGSRELMRAHNIEGLPSRAREAEMVGPNQEAVYLSVSGNLSAIFLVELRADRLVKFWTRQCMRHNICLILRSVDPMITLNRVETTFEIPAGMLKIIPARMHKEYDQETAPVEHMSASMACTGSFASAAQLLIGTKVLRRAAMLGVFVQAVGILLGIGLVLLEAILGLGLTPAWMLIFQGVMTVLTLMTVNIHKTY
jgi:Cu+-exporting ATPase